MADFDKISEIAIKIHTLNFDSENGIIKLLQDSCALR